MTMFKDIPTPVICSYYTASCHTHTSPLLTCISVCAVKTVEFMTEIYH